jgi:ABC-type amino acid transport substrate-binding protein
MKRFFSVLAVSAALSMLFAGCTGATSSVASIRQRGELVVATHAGFVPFEFVEGDKVAGIDVEIARAIAGKLGVGLRIDDLTADAVVDSVKTGKADLGISALSASDEQKKIVDFSDPYFSSTVVMLVAKDNDTLKTKDDLKGRRLGVQPGTPADMMVASTIEGAEVIRMNTDAESVQELVNGRLDAALMGVDSAEAFALQNSDAIQLIDTPLSGEPYAIAVQKGNAELLKVVNEALKELKDSGQLDEILDQYGIIAQ